MGRLLLEGLLLLHTLHRINTSLEHKLDLYQKNIFSKSRKLEKLIYKNNYSRWLYLRKRSIVDVWQCFEYARVLNMSGFWVYHSSESATVLNISRLRICLLFCIYQGSKYARVTEGSGDAYACLCLNMSEYARICVNIPLRAWMAFVLNLFIVISLGCFLEETKSDFYSSSWEYLICFLSKTKYLSK